MYREERQGKVLVECGDRRRGEVPANRSTHLRPHRGAEWGVAEASCFRLERNGRYSDIAACESRVEKKDGAVFFFCVLVSACA